MYAMIAIGSMKNLCLILTEELQCATGQPTSQKCVTNYIYIYIPHRRNEEQSPAAAAASHQTALPLLPLLALPLPALPLPAAPPLTALPLPTLPLGAPTASPLPPAAGASSLFEKKLRLEMRVIKGKERSSKRKSG